MAFYGTFPKVSAECEERQISQVVVDFGLAEARMMVPRKDTGSKHYQISEKSYRIGSHGWIDTA
jgi:hypothetical protein